MSDSGLPISRRVIQEVRKLAQVIGVKPFTLLVCVFGVANIAVAGNEWAAISSICVVLLYTVHSLRECYDAKLVLDERREDRRISEEKLANAKRPRRAKLQAEQPNLPLGDRTDTMGDRK